MTHFSPTPTPRPSTESTDATPAVERGSKDGRGCADNDQPYRFGRRPSSAAPFPFTSVQFGRLLVLRGRIGDGLVASDDVDRASTAAAAPHKIARGRRTRLFRTCLSCGVMVAGSFDSDAHVFCPRCAPLGERDGVARVILESAGVLEAA
jgi:hypothetical protein